MNDVHFAKSIIERSRQAKADREYWEPTRNEVIQSAKLRVAITNARLIRMDFQGEDLHNLCIEGSEVAYCRFMNADLEDACFWTCDLSGSNFSNAILNGVNFAYSDLSGANFSNANLKYTGWCNADLSDTQGIKLVAPVGYQGRLVFAFTRDGKIFIQAGCRCDSPAKVRKAVKDKYWDVEDAPMQEDYLDAIKLLQSWGKRELTRLRNQNIIE